jgi:hypothetical protein
MVLASALCVVSFSLHAEIFKCRKANGTVVYQNFSCELDSIGSSATAPPIAPRAPAVAAPAGAPAAGSDVDDGWNSKPRVTAARSPPTVGMTPRQVRRISWGEPDKVNYIHTADGRLMTWTYADNHMIHFDARGRVASYE